MKHPTTPDGRYFVHRGRLWRCTDPSLAPAEREQLVAELMRARRDVGVAKRAEDEPGLRAARARVHAAKVALGERGPPWWEGDDPDFGRHLVENTPYSAWWAARQRDRP